MKCIKNFLKKRKEKKDKEEYYKDFFDKKEQEGDYTILDFNDLDDFSFIIFDETFNEFNRNEKKSNKYKFYELGLTKTFFGNMNEMLDISFTFNKKSFDNDLNSIFIGEDLDVEKIKKALIRKNIKEDDILVINDIKEAPISTHHTENIDNIIEVQASLLCDRIKSPEKLEKYLSYMVLIHQRGYYGLKKSEQDCLKTYEELTNKKMDSIAEIKDDILKEHEVIREVFDITDRFLNVNNKFDYNKHYILDFKSVDDIKIFFSLFINYHHNLLIENDLTENKNYKSLEYMDSINELKRHRTQLYINYKSVYKEGFAVEPASGCRMFLKNIFLNENDILDNPDFEQEYPSIKANTVLKVYKDPNNPFLKEEIEAGHHDYVYDFSKKTKKKK